MYRREDFLAVTLLSLKLTCQKKTKGGRKNMKNLKNLVDPIAEKS